MIYQQFGSQFHDVEEIMEEYFEAIGCFDIDEPCDQPTFSNRLATSLWTDVTYLAIISDSESVTESNNNGFNISPAESENSASQIFCYSFLISLLITFIF